MFIILFMFAFHRACFFFILALSLIFFFFFFNDTATTEIYTLSLHDALPICFKDEVGSHAAAQKADKTLPNLVESEDGFAVPEGEEDDRCGSNWKAATSKELPPATKEVFEQTGVFACLCRHGIVEFLIEFVQSGEKYASVCSLSFLN